METETIVQQINAASRQAAARARAEYKPVAHSSKADFDQVVQAAYLSGISQAVSFLIRADGEVTAQQLERAVVELGKEMGFTYSPPK